MMHNRKWVLFGLCALVKRPIILGLSHLPNYRRPGLTCYRWALCEAEKRECWLARPMDCETVPFDWDEALRKVERDGRRFECGPEPAHLVLEADIPVPVKRQILQEFLDHEDALSLVATYEPRDIIRALDSLP